MLQRRDLAVSIVLTIITCGIYGFYWMYCLTQDANYISGDQSMSPGTTILLTIVTCGIYGIYWAYKMGKNIQYAKAYNGRPAEDRSTLYLILAIFGLQIVNYALMQDDLNSLAA